MDDIFLSLDKEKKGRLNLWDRYVLRLPSYYLSYFLYNYIGLGANAVSVLSAVIAVFAFSLVYYSPVENFLVMAVLLNFWVLLDCVDGNIARTLALKYGSTNIYGELFDSLSGYTVLAGLWVTVGFYLMQIHGETLYLLEGAFSSIMALFSRMINLRLMIVKGGPSVNRNGWRYRIFETIEIGGLLTPMLVVSYLANEVLLLMHIYFFINFFLMVYAFFMLVKDIRLAGNSS